jgi:hypothetical protein
MKLYKIRLEVNAREINRINTFDAILEGDDISSQDGDWSAADDTSEKLFDIYLDDTEGYWERRRSEKYDFATIYLYNHDQPNVISQFWRTPMLWVVTLNADNKWPLSLGGGMRAYRKLDEDKNFDCTWRVIHRYF